MDRFYQYKSPFVFDEPYTIEKKESFFGRQKTIEEISRFFDRTNLLTIYGPVGSGKSSIAQCGFSKIYVDWNPHTIYRNGNFVQSFEFCLSNEVKGIDAKIVEGLFKNIREYRREQRKIDSLNSSISQYYEDIRLNKNRKETFKERKDFNRSRNTILKFKKDQKELLITIYHNMENLQMSCAYKPVFVFDQFEELFIEGEKEEIETMKLILSVLKKSVEFSKNIVCIQDDLFSHLREFENYVPNMLRDSVVVDYVSKDELSDIILKNFQYYNINQVFVPDKKSERLPYQGIPKKDKKERVQLIIDQLKKNDKVHLPFLQLYLNRLYVEDFARTYRKSIEDLKDIQDQEYYRNKPLEFTRKEIQAFGNIQRVLGVYLKEVNDRLVEKENQITSERGYKDVTLRFLKYFVNENGTSKSLKIGLTVDKRKNRERKKFLNLKDGDLKNKIKMDIWKSRKDVIDQSIGDLIRELRLARILVKRKYYIELSHNLLAPIIRDIPIKEEVIDYVDYYGNEFNASFETYKKRREEERKHNFFFLRNTPSNRVIKTVKKNIDVVIATNDKERTEKIAFLKKARNTLKLRKWLVIIIGIAFVIGVRLSYSEIIDSKDKKNEKVQELRITRNILEKLDEITSDAEYDATLAFKQILMQRNYVKGEEPRFSLNNFPSINRIFHSYVSNYTSNSFYSASFDISEYPIFKNKNIHQLTLPNPWDSRKKNLDLKGYFLNSGHLYNININTKDLVIGAPELVLQRKPDNIISSFEPFFSNPTSEDIMVSDSEGVKIISGNEPGSVIGQSIESDSRFHNLRNIKYLRNLNSVKTFVGIKNRRDKLIKIIHNSNTNIITGRNIGMNNFYLKKIIDSTITKEKVEDVKIKYVVRKDNNEICFVASLNQLPYVVKMKVGRGFGEDDQILDTLNLKSISKNISVNDITAFSSNNKKKMAFIAIENIVYPLNLDKFFVEGKRFAPAVVLPTGAKVTSISSYRNKLLLSSENRKAYLYSFNESNTKIIGITHILKKKLQGHKEAVNMAVLIPTNERKNLKAISVGEDGRILLWDLKSTEEKENKVPEGLDVFDLDYARINNQNSLLIGYNHMDPTNPKSSIYKFNDNLNIRKSSKAYSFGNSNLNTIDVDEEGTIYVGAFRKGYFGQFNKRPININNDSNEKRRINKLRVFNNQLIIATNKGIVYYENKNDLQTKPRIEMKSISFNTAEFYPDSNRNIIIGTSDNGNIYAYDFKKDTSKILNHHSDKVRDATFSKNGKYLVSGSWDNTAIVWKTENIDNLKFKPIDTISDPKNDIEDIAFNQNFTFALASSDNHVYIYEIDIKTDSIKRIPSFVAHRFPVRALVFDNDSCIYSVDKLGNLKKWAYRNAVKKICNRIGGEVCDDIKNAK